MFNYFKFTTIIAIVTLLSYEQFYQLKRDSASISFRLPTTHDHFDIFSGCLVECLGEPRHVWVSTAGNLQPSTVLSISKWVISEKSYRDILNSVECGLTVVVLANNGWSLSRTPVVAEARIIGHHFCINSSCVSPYVLPRVPIYDGCSIKSLESTSCTKLVSYQLPAHLRVRPIVGNSALWHPLLSFPQRLINPAEGKVCSVKQWGQEAFGCVMLI